MLNVASLAFDLIRIPSITGSETAVAQRIAEELTRIGMKVVRQPVAEDRFNVYASQVDHPKVIFCSHLDTVPPFMGPTQKGDDLYGRGACDAKGIIAAQLTAADRLLEDGVSEIGFLYLVGEEVDHIGAREASKLAIGSQYIIIGEPTDLKMAKGSKGIVKCTLSTTGRKAHSAYPEKGDSAILKLLDLLEELRSLKWPADDELGETTWNIGTISGGVAANVIADEASAQFLFRTVTSSEGILKELEKVVKGRGTLTLQTMNGPIQMHTLPGFEPTVVAYNTDAPYLTSLGKLILFGPGSILDAHTDEEKISISELRQAVDDYCKIVRKLISI